MQIRFFTLWFFVSLFLLHIAILLSFVPIGICADGEGDDDGPDNEKKVDVRVTQLRARISPQFEVVLPTGDLYQHFTTNFNDLEMAFNLHFSVIGNTLGGDIIFCYPFGKWSPYIKFSQELDFENYLSPRLEGSELLLVPTDKYIWRERGVNPGLKYEIFQSLYLEPSFIVKDIFKGSLTENRVIDEGVDIVPQMSLVFDNVYAEETADNPYFKGMYLQTTFSMRYRNNFDTPVSIGNENLFLIHHHLRLFWFFEERITLNYPIYIWNRELFGFHTLGGFESIRGYDTDSINAFRFCLLSSNIEREFLKGKELKIKLSKRRAVVLHQYRVLMFFDALITQDHLNLSSDLHKYASAGIGAACNFSGRESTHFNLRLYAAQGFTEKFAPIIYLRTSMFNFSTKL